MKLGNLDEAVTWMKEALKIFENKEGSSSS
jgi:hypothetical protein